MDYLKTADERGMTHNRQPMTNEPFLLGVNYWPRRKAMSWWSDFDAGEVRDEFALVHELGMSVVRIFLLWDDFQPQPDTVSSECLAHLTQVCDIAAASRLKLDITFFTGHMSGPNWAPQWLLGTPRANVTHQVVSRRRVVDSGYRNPFTDAAALDAERHMLRTVVGALGQNPAVWMWNLGNEPDLFAHPPAHEIGRAWVREMKNVIRELDNAHPVTCGLHADSLLQDNGLRVDEVFGETDVAVMHAYPMYAEWARGPLDPWFVPYACAMTAALCGKPVLMQEFGGCTALPGQASHTRAWTGYGVTRTQFMASEDAMFEYVAATLHNLHTTGATGALLWCFADYAPELWNRPPLDEARHERFFGLVRPDGSLKPHALEIKRFAASRPQVQPIPAWARPEMDAHAYYENPQAHLIGAYPKFLENIPEA